MALCACVEVLFNIDKGHEVQYVHPAGVLTQEELSDVAFSAFPDSMSAELKSGSSVRDSAFCFRLRRRPAKPGSLLLPNAFLYGHAFCRQRQDERLRRGCEQRSIVLLSHLPLFCLLEPLARLVGPAALSYGPDTLREVFEEVQRWPPLEWGCRMSLPLLGLDTLTVELPLLTMLPGSSLPAAVGASLGPQQPAAPEQLSTPPEAAAHGASTSSNDGSAVQPPGAQEAGEVWPSRAAVASGHGAPEAGVAADGVPPAAAAAAAGRPVATPAQVAAALAEELDGCDGLPLCLLPQAYGRQELEATPFDHCDCFTPLRASLHQLWALWEALLLGEPLMVVAPSPGICSATVTALLSLLAPFPYSLDYRPYFNLHDPAFAKLASGTAPNPTNGLPMLLGVTNVYFLKALPEWPNVLSTGHTAETLPPSSSSDSLQEAAGTNGSSGMHPSQSAASLASSSSGRGGGGGAAGAAWHSGSSSRLASMLRRRPASPASLLSEPMDQCWLGYKPLSKPDKQVIQSLVQPQPSDPADKWQRLAAVNSGILRRHFQALTKALLLPLLPYFTPSLPPPPSSQASDPRAAPPQPPPLPQLDLLVLLARLGSKEFLPPQLLLERFGGRANLLAFYERFLRSPNLVAFVQLRRLAAGEWQRQQWAAAAAAVRAPMEELMTVESFYLLGQQLAKAQAQLEGGSGANGGANGGDGTGSDAEAAALAAQLRLRLQLAFQELPEDYQQAILHTPSHAALLGLQQQQQQQQPDAAMASLL